MKVIIPTGGAERDKELALALFKKSKHDREVYDLYSRYLFDSRMKLFWQGFCEIHEDPYHQHLFFIWILNSIQVWGELDRRSKVEKKQSIAEIKSLIFSLKAALKRERNTLAGYPEGSHVVTRAMGLGLVSRDHKGSELYKKLDSILKALKDAEELCEESLANDFSSGFPSRYFPKTPNHLKRAGAVRTFLIEEVVMGYISLFEKNPTRKMIGLVGDAISCITDIDTTSDAVRMYLNRKKQSKYRALKKPNELAIKK